MSTDHAVPVARAGGAFGGGTGLTGGLFAGMTIAMLPILVVYVVFQRQVQTGLTGATVK